MTNGQVRAGAGQENSTPHGRTRTGFRPEVQGLRALAVLMVVVYHVWLGKVSGGVDVFLLISAFLLTGSFVAKVEAGKPLRLLRYWLHRFKSLLPAVVVVLLAVLAASALMVPRSRWADIFTQTWSSLFYFQNWTLAGESVDYYAADHSTASPLQHFWSLSIQGQVFILWPLIFAAAAVAARLLRLRYRTVLAAVFAAVFAASLVFSIQQTGANQAHAYFDTRARLWEFALGSLLALALPYLNFRRGIRVFLGWFGIVAMLSCGILLQVQEQFPGYIALWPTLAAACIVVAGQSGSRFGADRILGSTALTRLGDNSYALYLWHWPVLVIYLIARERSEPGLFSGAVIILVSLVLAFATTKLVDTPIRSWHWPQLRRRRLGLVIAASMAIVAAPLTTWQIQVGATEAAARNQTPQDNPGAAALDPAFSFQGSTKAVVKPLTSQLSQEWAAFDSACAGDYATEDPALALCYQAGDPQTAVKTIIVVGDSHAQHWMSALAPVAEANHWFVAMVHMPACRFGAGSVERTPECNAFNAAARQYVLAHSPDAVFTLASLTKSHQEPETLVPDYLPVVQDFTAAGIQVVGLRDTPRFEFLVPECLDRRGPDPASCAVPQSSVLAEVSPLDGLEVPGLGLMDMTDQLCMAGVCPGVIGNVLVYMDQSHLSKTYVETTRPVFEQRFKAALGWD